jgi:hypothetical protein
VRLYAKPIKNYANINQFDYASEWTIRQGEANTLHFQLVDADQDNLRYLTSDGTATVQVTFPAVNSANIISKAAAQVSSLDRSIWSVSLLSTEIPASGNVQIAVTENGSTRRFSLLQGLIVELINAGGC